MNAQESLRNAIAAISAATGGLNAAQAMNTPLSQTIQVQSSGNMSQILSLPVLWASPIQDLDPTSPTFGQFFWMMDFDGLAP